MSRAVAKSITESEAELTIEGKRQLRVAVFADGANYDEIVALAADPFIKGFTTNPTLMRAAGVSDYPAFARQVLEIVTDHPISFEVFADDFTEMERQALEIASWGNNVFVKIPVTNTKGQSAYDLARRLAGQGVKLNITALMTAAQVEQSVKALADGPQSFISVFAGRIADTGRDPLPIMRESLQIMAPHEQLRLIWASPREALNIVQADRIGCHVITVTHDLLKKASLFGKDLDDYSLDTVKMFFSDAQAAAYQI